MPSLRQKGPGVFSAKLLDPLEHGMNMMLKGESYMPGRLGKAFQ